MPDLIGMEAMDAIAIVENLGAKVVLRGSGRVSSQSLKAGAKMSSTDKVTLTLL
jgi:cell division protein FtsI (penicillin-binding protein 3)